MRTPSSTDPDVGGEHPRQPVRSRPAHGHEHGGDGHGHEPGHGHEHGDGHGERHRQGLLGLVRSIFSPHSHDPMESVDQALARSDTGMRTLQISLVVLAATAAVQMAIVVLSSSVALLGETVHNLADALTAVPLGLAFWLERKPPTRRYTYGYGRAEDLAGAFICATIAASSIVAGWVAVDRLVHPRPVHHLGWVAVAGAVGFLGNEVVAVYRIRVGRRIGSAALVADGLHARTDGITSLAVVAGAAGVAAGWSAADPIVGLLITVAILDILRHAVHDIYRRLMDSVDPELVDQVEHELSTVKGVERIEAVRIRWIGHELHAEVSVISDRNLTLAAAHAISEEAHHRLLHEIPRLSQALIHSDPCADVGEEPHALTAHHFHGWAGQRGPQFAPDSAEPREVLSTQRE